MYITNEIKEYKPTSDVKGVATVKQLEQFAPGARILRA